MGGGGSVFGEAVLAMRLQGVFLHPTELISGKLFGIPSNLAQRCRRCDLFLRLLRLSSWDSGPCSLFVRTEVLDVSLALECGISGLQRTQLSHDEDGELLPMLPFHGFCVDCRRAFFHDADYDTLRACPGTYSMTAWGQ